MSMGYITMYRLSSCDAFKYGSKPKNSAESYT